VDHLSSTTAVSVAYSGRAGTMDAGKRKEEDSSVQLANLFRYEELFLRVLSFLSPTDLASVQSVNRYWSRMTLDPQVSEVAWSRSSRPQLIL
jgi:hypothetical protein